MLLTSIDPFLQEVERQFGRMAGEGLGMPMDGMRRDDEVILRFDVPGVDPSSIEVPIWQV
ncbi:Hsp20/alpha crystallin family protein [Nonomuraea africana]|uniref:HSP20 family molecular chaperone IbpA n=1 Tax=Nonomuraea africana TaxID=46171 RepID=A0ABR9KCG5_9ACTN|nr:hypothetical protein [Nonomuraea africana]MBE1559242.1 HSP20 family molecular chaperone IbpA [Nonomuraea africana]